MGTVTKKELIERVSSRSGAKRTVIRKAIQDFLDQIIVELRKGNRIEFRDFGVFEVKQRAPRQAQNPKTLERVPVPAKRTVKFKVGRLMRESVEAAGEAARVATATSSTPGVDGRVQIEAKPEARKATPKV